MSLFKNKLNTICGSFTPSSHHKSVGPSVTNLNCVKTNEHTIKLSIILVFRRSIITKFRRSDLQLGR